MAKYSILEMIRPIIKDGPDYTTPTVQWGNYLNMKKQAYGSLNSKELEAHLISEANWMMRNQAKSCEQFRVKIRIGDICYIDFGPAYVNEAGFQHFGLVLSMMNSKAFVVPMTSNSATYKQAYDAYDYPLGKRHLMRLGLIHGMNKESALFLNDCKYINTARIIDVKAHLDPEEDLFKSIKQRVLECLVEP